MTPQQLKNAILQQAIQGKLVEQIKEECVSTELFNAKKNKDMNVLEFEIPNNWKLSTIEGISKVISTKKYQIRESETLKDGLYPVISQSKEAVIGFSNDKNKLLVIKKPVIIFGDHTTVVKYIDFNFVVGADGIKIFEPIDDIEPKFFKYSIDFLSIGLEKKGGYSRHYKFIKNLSLPVPPLTEQKRIVEKIEELLPLVERYEKAWTRLEELNKKFPLDMQKAILGQAIQGKLVEQRAEEGTGEELYKAIQDEKQQLIQEGKLKKQKALPEITEEEIPFDIPDTWKWVRLGEICEIARGGSPRPIKEYITTNSDGINWIKIGDTNQNDKYINQTKEKIIPEGIKKSRMVYPGDFLLTNSMSFGRPYILNITGCIHDGWLVLTQPQKIFNKDFLFWMLSSRFAYEQFSKKVSGAVVKNLNSDKVSSSIFPLPPLSEQKRIVEKIEELLPLVEKLK